MENIQIQTQCKAIGLLKLTLSPEILEQLRAQHSIDDRQSSIEELTRIFDLLKTHYGGCNYHRARLSLQIFENLPEFTDSSQPISNIPTVASPAVHCPRSPIEIHKKTPESYKWVSRYFIACRKV